jgi:hypothetical protein
MKEFQAQRRLIRWLRYGSRSKKNLVKESLKMQLRPGEAVQWIEGQMGMVKAGIRFKEGVKL